VVAIAMACVARPARGHRARREVEESLEPLRARPRQIDAAAARPPRRRSLGAAGLAAAIERRGRAGRPNRRADA